MYLLNKLQNYALNGYMGNDLQGFTDPFDVNVHSGGTGKATPDIADQFIPEIWGQAIDDVFEQYTMMSNLGTDLSPNVANAGDVINLPHIGVPELTAYTQGSEIAADVTSGGSMTDESSTLTVSEYNVASIYVPDIVNVQSSYDLLSIYTKKLAYAVGRGFDNYMHYLVANNLQGLLSSATGAVGADADTSIHVQTTGSALSAANLSSLMAIILGETGNTNGWNLVLSPAMYASLASLADFVKGTASPLGAGFESTGTAGNILGMPVWVAQSPYMDAAGADVSADATKGIKAVDDLETSGTDDNDIVYGYAIHDSALYYAFSKRAKITASYRHAYLSTLVTCESVYGGVAKNTDVQGDRRIVALVDYE
tara:strand:- start:1417 stop:2520 length:1104 start_codon:yes stop_codon:yes gene_type:complete